MKLNEFAEIYISQNRLKGRTQVHSANRFIKFVGDLDVGEIEGKHLSEYRSVAVRSGLRNKTIEGSITDIRTLVKAATGRVLDPGRRLKLPKPNPDPVPLESLGPTYLASPDWLKQWIALTYWTALRLSDSIEFQRHCRRRDPLTWQASKTDNAHVWPLPRWLDRHLDAVKTPYVRSPDHNECYVRDGITAACQAAGVPRWTPKQLRQRSISEWSRVNGAAGAIVHGQGLGIMNHYVDPLTVLEPAAPLVRVPNAFLTDDEREAREKGSAELLRTYERLDTPGRDLVLGMMRRLSG